MFGADLFSFAANPATIPVIGGMFDQSGKKSREAMMQNQDIMNGVALPELEWTDINPEIYSMQDAQFQLASEDPLIRSAQMSALSKMAGLADKGLSEEDAAAFAKAKSQGNQMARAGTEAALANAQARGVGGSGMEFAMREIANQQGAERAQQSGLEQAAAAARQRALYNQAYMQGASGIRGQDAQANQANTDIINRFNMANTQARNSMNQANVDQRNKAQMTNMTGKNDLAQRQFDNRMSRATGQMNANKGVADAWAAQNAANTAERNQWMQLGAQAIGAAAKGK
jgi:hypothetical protein